MVQPALKPTTRFEGIETEREARERDALLVLKPTTRFEGIETPVVTIGTCTITA